MLAWYYNLLDVVLVPLLTLKKFYIPGTQQVTSPKYKQKTFQTACFGVSLVNRFGDFKLVFAQRIINER